MSNLGCMRTEQCRFICQAGHHCSAVTIPTVSFIFFAVRSMLGSKTAPLQRIPCALMPQVMRMTPYDTPAQRAGDAAQPCIDPANFVTVDATVERGCVGFRM